MNLRNRTILLLSGGLVMFIFILIYAPVVYGMDLLRLSNDGNNNDINIYQTQILYLICTETWSCTDWSSCADESQTRTCSDVNNCGTNESIPSLNQTCDTGGSGSGAGSPSFPSKQEVVTGITPLEVDFGENARKFLITLIVFLTIVGTFVFVFGRKNKKD